MNIRELELSSDGYLGWETGADFEQVALFNQDGIDESVCHEGAIEIDISDLHDGNQPAESQWKALEYFNDNQAHVLNSICKGVFDKKAELIDIYDEYEEDEYGGYGIPDWKTPEDIARYISISSIYVLDDEKDSYAYVGYSGACSWDSEHGFGVMTHKDRVLIVGDWSVASSGSKLIHLDNDTYTEEMRLEEEATEQRIREEIEKERQRRLEEEELDRKQEDAIKSGDIRNIVLRRKEGKNTTASFVFEGIKAHREFRDTTNENKEGRIKIEFDEVGKKEIAEIELATLIYFDEHQEKVLDALCAEFYSRWSKLMKNHELFPVLSIEGVKKKVEYRKIHVVCSSEKEGCAYLKFEIELPSIRKDRFYVFDVLMHKDRFLSLGTYREKSILARKIRKDGGRYFAEGYDAKPWWKFW